MGKISIIRQCIFFIFMGINLIAFCQKTDQLRIENINFEKGDKKFDITFNIANAQPDDEFIVQAIPVAMPGKKIIPSSALANGSRVTGAGKHTIIWEFAKEGLIFTGQEIYFEVKAAIIPKIKTSGVVAKSLIMPGLGQYQLKKGKPYWIWTALGYGLAGAAAYYGYKSVTDYNAYKNSADIDEANSLFESAQSSQQIAMIAGAGAGAIWTINLLDAGAKKGKAVRSIPISGSKPDFNGIPYISNVSKSRWVDTRPPFEIAKLKADSLLAITKLADARAKYLDALKYQPNDPYCTGKVSAIDAQLAQQLQKKVEIEVVDLQKYFKKAEEKYAVQIESEMKSSGLFNVEDEEYMTKAELEAYRIRQNDYKKAMMLEYAKKYKSFLEQTIRKSFGQVEFGLEIEGNYNAELEEFAIVTNDQNFKVKVPRNEAKFFKANSDKVKVIADRQLDENGEIYLVFNYRAINPTTGSEYQFGPQRKALYLDLEEGEITGVPKVFASVKFIETNNNQKLDALESGEIILTLENKGSAPAKGLIASLSSDAPETFSFDRTASLPTLAPNEIQKLIFKISASKDIPDGKFNFNFDFKEAMGFKPEPVKLVIESSAFQAPQLAYGGFTFKEIDGNINNIIENSDIIEAMLDIVNLGKGPAENVSFTIIINDINIKPLKREQLKTEIGTLLPGQKVSKPFRFIVNNEYQIREGDNNILPISMTISEKYMQYGCQANLNIKIKTSNDFAPSLSDVDENIPAKQGFFANRFAIIIGNEDYASFQQGLTQESNVAFARYDAIRFKEYAVKVFGIPESNIRLLTDATTGRMNQDIELITKMAKTYGMGAEIIFYYAGHGFPDENSKVPYLVPVDVNAANITSAIKLTDIYTKLSETGADRVTVFLDACFSGGGRQSGLLSARMVKLKPRIEIPSGKLVCFTASSGEQSSLPYNQKQHGMFTYFLLKALQETKGEISYEQLDDYLLKNVSMNSLQINGKEQNPQLNISNEVGDDWKTWTIR